MKTTNRLAFALALALGTTAAGCGPGGPADAGDDDGAGDGSNPGGQDQRQLDASGTYTVHSAFNIAANVPGTAGTVVNDIIAATDDPGDPSKWILDEATQKASSTVKGIISVAEGLGAVDFLNSELLSFAPDFVTTVIQVGKDFGDITKNFGLIETLEVTGASGAYTATHTVTGVHFKIGTLESDYLLANYHAPNIVVSNVGITMDQTGALTIAPHTIPLTYGKILRLGLDGAIIPLIDPTAQNLDDLFAHLVDCDALGQLVANNFDIPFLTAGAISGVCTLGLTAAANLIYSEIDKIDASALQFALSGTAKGTDTNGDGKVDAIVTGGWTGMLSYGNTPTPLVPATFSGTRN